VSEGEEADSDDTTETEERDWLERGVDEGDVSVDLDTPPGADEDADGTDERPDASADTEFGDGATNGAVDGGVGEGGQVEDTETGETEDRGQLFEQDFASALGDTDVPGGADGAPPEEPGQGPPGAGAGPGASGGPPGDAGASGEFGGGDLAGGGELGESEGFGGGFGGGIGGDDFEDEEFDTDIDRIDLGIEGLDEMIQGGVPERSLMVAIGSAGTGKTTFGIQFLNEELRTEGGNAVYITLEESRERIINSATEKGYPFDEYVESGRLAIVDLDPIEMANSLATIRSELPRLISEFDARRLVLDSVSLLEMMYDDRAKRRNEIYDFTQSLKEAGVTTMMTSEADADSAYTSRHGIVEYLTDAVFVLQYVRPSDFRKTRLAIEIQKIRDANHSRETKPYEITNEGISVYRQANIF
jgi:KaiC domain protein